MTPDVHPKHRGGRYAAQSPLTPALWRAQANISAPMVPTFQINKICPFGRFLEKFSFTEHIKHEIKGFLVFSSPTQCSAHRPGSGMDQEWKKDTSLTWIMDYVLYYYYYYVSHTYRIISLKHFDA